MNASWMRRRRCQVKFSLLQANDLWPGKCACVFLSMIYPFVLLKIWRFIFSIFFFSKKKCTCASSCLPATFEASWSSSSTTRATTLDINVCEHSIFASTRMSCSNWTKVFLTIHPVEGAICLQACLRFFPKTFKCDCYWFSVTFTV